MPVFTYKARTTTAKEMNNGQIEADTQTQAVARLNAKGLYPILLMEKNHLGLGNDWWPSRRVSRKVLLSFFRELSDLTKAGLRLLESMEVIEHHLKPSPLKQIVIDIRESLNKGIPFSKAMEQHPAVFSPFFVSLVKSGEMAGVLDSSLERIADTMEKEEDIRSKMTAALAYPSLIAVVGFITAVFLLTFVIPKLGSLFLEMGQSMPLLTRLVYGTSLVIRKFWWLSGFIIPGGYYGVRHLKSKTKLKLWRDQIIFNIPVLAPLLSRLISVELTRSLGTLLKHGVPILDSLDVVAKSQDNHIIRTQLMKVGAAVREGRSLSGELSQISLFPDTLCAMIRVGEKTGHLDAGLLRAADIFEKEADRQIKIFTSILEPVMIVAVGTVLGMMVIAMLLPIFEINLFVK